MDRICRPLPRSRRTLPGLRRCLRRLGRSLPLATTLVLARLSPAAEVVVRNDSLEDGGTAAIQAGFVANERAAAWLTSPCNGRIVAVQVLWLSLTGNRPPQIHDSIRIHADGTFPVPGPVLAQLEAPLMVDGFLNEFRYLDEDNTIPIDVPVAAGQRFVVVFQFATNAGAIGPSVCTDVDGCQPFRNGIFAIPPSQWFGACGLGVSGDFVIRAVVDCDEVAGACCLPNGSCVQVGSSDCADFGGTFQGEGTTCAQVSCPQPPVACCFETTGGCLNLTAQDCLAAGGVPAGAGTSCATYECFPAGACCLPDGGCVENVSPEDCAAQGGTYQGNDTICASVNCPQPSGACCFSTGFCLALLEADCMAAGATWAGPHTTCADLDGSGTADACEAGPCDGDVNGDGQVLLDDLSALLGAFQTCLGDPAYEAGADFDASGCITLADLSALLTNFGGPCD